MTQILLNFLLLLTLLTSIAMGFWVPFRIWGATKSRLSMLWILSAGLFLAASGVLLPLFNLDPSNDELVWISFSRIALCGVGVGVTTVGLTLRRALRNKRN